MQKIEDVEKQFYQLLQSNEDRQAVRQFRILFQAYQTLDKLSPSQDKVIGIGIINMIALSELGRNEKNYIPDANTMITSLSRSNTVERIEKILDSINQRYWRTAANEVKELEKTCGPMEVFAKAISFLEGQAQTQERRQARRQNTELYNTEQIIKDVKHVMLEQAKLI